MTEKKKPTAKSWFLFWSFFILMGLLKFPIGRWIIGFMLFGAAVLFFIYVVFIRGFIIYGRKE